MMDDQRKQLNRFDFCFVTYTLEWTIQSSFIPGQMRTIFTHSNFLPFLPFHSKIYFQGFYDQYYL